jgi:ribonuclease HII
MYKGLQGKIRKDSSLVNFDVEKKLGGVVIGVDEAGRGPLAGPVVAAAVIINNLEPLLQVNDSKKVSKTKREVLYKLIEQHTTFGIGMATVEEIDSINILQATLLAMRRAIEMVKVPFDYIIVDGNISPYPKQANIIPIIGGDAKSISIAAASIMAKVTRDRIMDDLHQQYPDYGWASNSGYGTKLHIDAIKSQGITPHHRKSFLKKFY